MSDVEFIYYTTDESTYPEGRARAFRLFAHITDAFSKSIPDLLQCYLGGLMQGWLFRHTIGIKDIEDLRGAFTLLSPDDDIFVAMPFGRREIAPEVSALREDELIDEAWHWNWMGICNDLYHFKLLNERMPERSVYSWLGFLRGELEGETISNLEYDRLRAMLPVVEDPFTPLVSSVP